MKSFRAWIHRSGELFLRRQRERELAEEMESHLALHIADNLRAGMTPEEVTEVLMMVAIYGGVPAANSAFKLAKEAYEEMQKES